MNTFQQMKEGNLIDTVKDSDPAVKKTYEAYEETKHKLILALDTKVYNGDFEGAQEILADDMPLLGRAIERIQDAGPHSSDEMGEYTDDFEYNDYNPMENDI